MTGFICSDGRWSGKSLLLVPTRLESGCLLLITKSPEMSLSCTSLSFFSCTVCCLLVDCALALLKEILELSELKISLFLYRFF